ncbi:hypothetical protein [Sphingomonas aracearum]|uniref:Uncharacterized protein n=1 Tax=Sphingomonas aracearum TaxID=2283317 RepID=A0A369VZR6_9SPHN|nr:hypothetical protein [Sphingomonas aracearum]RDE07289.1 hypothetical protein DVW87_06595 [Sphingomonas aracearum]
MSGLSLAREQKGDVVAALALACLLCLVWAFRDGHNLAALRLPDTDDAVRLQQIRDWLGGQAFADLSQHRLGGGLAMHWSRLPDLVPAAIIVLLRPLIGGHAAQVVAVIAWPALLLFAALALVATIARTLGGGAIARTALVVAAIAYPATTLFLPGRIDHHGLQCVLLLVVLRTSVTPPTIGRGLHAGFAATASLVVGLETAPLIAAAGVAMAIDWLRARSGAEDRLMGFGIALGSGLLAASIVFRTWQWTYPACDGFTATAWRGAQIGAFAPILLALAARDVVRPASRIGLAAIVCGLIGWGVLHGSALCLAPYGAVDPLLAKLWLVRVGEAQPLLSAPLDVAIGYAGVMVAGIAAGAWQWRRTRDARWGVLLIVQIACAALTLAQLRGAYAGALLAAPALAAAIAAARAKGSAWMAAAWLGSAGMLYPIAAQAVVPAPARGARATPVAVDAARPGCTSPEALAALHRLGAGTLLAPLDLGAYALAGSRLAVVGAPYHRNNAGNNAVYRFFLDGDARGIAGQWHVTHVAICADSFDELGRLPAAALATRLREGNAPGWLRPLPDTGTQMRLFAVQAGLSRRTGAR